MSERRFLILFAALGFVVPVAFEIAFAVIQFDHLYSFRLDYWFQTLRLWLWPPSALMLALDGVPNWSFVSLRWIFMLALLNVPIYAAIGAIWWMISRARREG